VDLSICALYDILLHGTITAEMSFFLMQKCVEKLAIDTISRDVGKNRAFSNHNLGKFEVP
jgi:hypothetical protein